MALYIPHSIFRLARLLYVRPEPFGPYYILTAFERPPEITCMYFGNKEIYLHFKISSVLFSTKCRLFRSNNIHIFLKACAKI